MSNNITIRLKPWMVPAAWAAIFFLASYLMAVTMPDCAKCYAGSASGLQVFHGIFMVLFGIGSVAAVIGAFFTWNDGRARE